ncbi:phosphoribosylanthranilate isomerase [Ruminococcus flavefaciens]|uniref:N-(5'-phosphoribosyl)anthranilate isomerase n=1 Tax=Ruminococcus flavefaciens TaxID=1265 RepID=A0A1M7JU50_RUMFL|nr:phosphoribosylanthranilate isomerase [Ruminococcus flavefaciens]SHM56546.1 phosphoribosylanthranilate isomerase [Ruminococcus flavefaciens]
MTKIKMCGLRREADIEFANKLRPEYIGYVFAQSSKRYVQPEKAAELTKKLDKNIIPVGVFVNSPIEEVIGIVRSGAVRAVQLHGEEDEDYIAELKKLDICVIRAFKVRSEADVRAAEESSADYVLLDSGQGSGETFDWSVIGEIKREYFLAGGLTADNAAEAIQQLHPYAVDASSCLEIDGFKDFGKMKAFAEAVRGR